MFFLGECFSSFSLIRDVFRGNDLGLTRGCDLSHGSVCNIYLLCTEGQGGSGTTRLYGVADAEIDRHDHGNSWCQHWNTSTLTVPGMDNTTTDQGLNLCFGQHSG